MLAQPSRRGPTNPEEVERVRRLLPSREQAQIPVIFVKKRQRKRGRRSGCLLRIRRRESKLPLPSVLLAKMQSLEHLIDDLRLRLSYQRDMNFLRISGTLATTSGEIAEQQIQMKLP